MRIPHARLQSALLASAIAFALLAGRALWPPGEIRTSKLLFASSLPGVFAASDQGATLKAQNIELDGFSVIGTEVRTNNTEAGKVIPRQWDRFFKEGLSARIPNRTDSNIVVVYSNYASDHRGDFDYLIGARVQDGSKPPTGMTLKVVPKARYAVLTTAQGPVGKVVSEAWQKIWTLEDSGGLAGRRTYKADFEVYDQRSRDPNNSQVDIYIGVE
jgi:predicted transcriptional regulator YdeE